MRNLRGQKTKWMKKNREFRKPKTKNVKKQVM